MQCNPFQSRPEFEKLYIFGAGGFGREVAWLAEQTWGTSVTVEFLVDDVQYRVGAINNVKVALLSEVVPNDVARFVVAMGDPQIRRQKAEACRAASLTDIRVIHPRAELSRWVQIGSGSIICAGTIATTNIHIGHHVHINLDCTIGHDVVVGDYSTLSPGVHISGNVRIGESVFIGTGANIINGSPHAPLTIGDGAIVAAGACVIHSVPAGAMVAGVPAVKKISRSR